MCACVCASACALVCVSVCVCVCVCVFVSVCVFSLYEHTVFMNVGVCVFVCVFILCSRFSKHSTYGIHKLFINIHKLRHVNKCLVSLHYTLFCICNGRKVYITCIDSVEKNLTVSCVISLN